MMLFHGTTASCLDRIKREGILPRAKAKGKQNWKHTVPSNKDAVYLTTAYPWHFAAVASKEKGIGLILEIDRDLLLPWLLCPDEDFMEQASRGCGPTDKNPNLAPLGLDMKKRTMFYRKIAKFNALLVDESLKHMGTCAYYGGIPFSAVTRYVLIDWAKLPFEMKLRAVDSMVSIMNYRILKSRHEAFCRWFFNDTVTVEEMLGYELGDNLTPAIIEQQKRYADKLAESMAQREGLTVITKGAKHGSMEETRAQARP
jgi:hypothetical protein